MTDRSLADVELSGMNSPSDKPKDLEKAPTSEELSTCEHISDRIPVTAKLLVFSQLCEGFTYFGFYIILQNFIQFPMPTGNNKQPGVLNLGRKTATTMILSFYCLCNFSPIVVAILADQFWGKYKTIIMSCVIYLVGLILLVLTSIPASIRAGAGLPALICSMVLLGIAAGGFKTLVGPLMADQYQQKAFTVQGED
jgi:POT family proton-dependent oligopeptide transporter